MSSKEIQQKIGDDVERAMSDLRSGDGLLSYWDIPALDEYRVGFDEALNNVVADLSYEQALYYGWLDDTDPIDERGNPPAYYEYVFREWIENILRGEIVALLAQREAHEGGE